MRGASRGCRGAWLGILVILLLTSISVTAYAAPRVALVTPANGDATVREAATRMRAELRAAGFEVIELEAGAGVDPRAQVEKAAPDARPFATVLIVPAASGAAAEIWVADHLTAKTLVRRVVARRTRGARPASALAIRALELLRASLLEVETGTPPESDEAASGPVPPEVTRWVEHPPPPPREPEQETPVKTPGTTPAKTQAPPEDERVSAVAAPEDQPEVPQRPWAPMIEHAGVEIGGGVLYSVGGLQPAFAPVVRAWFRLAHGLSVRGSFAGPALGPDLRAAAGVASLHQELATVDLAYIIALPPRWLVPLVSVGGGVLHIHVEGDASAPYAGTTANAWSAIFDAGAGLGIRPFESFALLLDGHAFLAAPRPVIALGNATTSAGRPALLGSLTGVVTF
jgi:hypothetical protein